jgi:hypothetical protein
VFVSLFEITKNHGFLQYFRIREPSVLVLWKPVIKQPLIPVISKTLKNLQVSQKKKLVKNRRFFNSITRTFKFSKHHNCCILEPDLWICGLSGESQLWILITALITIGGSFAPASNNCPTLVYTGLRVGA